MSETNDALPTVCPLAKFSIHQRRWSFSSAQCLPTKSPPEALVVQPLSLLSELSNTTSSRLLPPGQELYSAELALWPTCLRHGRLVHFDNGNVLSDRVVDLGLALWTKICTLEIDALRRIGCRSSSCVVAPVSTLRLWQESWRLVQTNSRRKLVGQNRSCPKWVALRAGWILSVARFFSRGE